MSRKSKISVVSEEVHKNENIETGLDDALTLAGFGLCNLRYCALFALFLIAVIIEVVGYSYVLPAAKCDLGLSDAQRGFIASIPYIAIVLMSYPWGYAVDVRGRKYMLMLSSFGAGIMGILAAFMPDVISFAVCKLIASLCIACPAAVPYAYIGELLPTRHRDLALSVTNALQMLGSALVPLMAWAIIPLSFRSDFGVYDFRPWRLLVILNSSLFVICAILICFAPESPKYLVSKGRNKEALDILRMIYAKNKNKKMDEFPVVKLKSESANQNGGNEKKKVSFFSSLRDQTLPIFKPPYVKWLALNGFLLFGVFATLNGLFMWVPDVLNRVLSGPTGANTTTACRVIRDRLMQSNNDTVDVKCDDSIETSIFMINSIANISCSVIVLLGSVVLKLTGKKVLLILLYAILGAFCISINFVQQDLVFAALLSSLQITALGIGPVNAYTVEIFPTHIRGMAVSLSLMLGRLGSVIGTNVAGLLLNTNCELTFNLFGGLLLLCGLLTFLLPKSQKK